MPCSEFAGGTPPTPEGDIFSACVIFSELVTRTLACERIGNRGIVGLWGVQDLVDQVISEVRDAHGELSVSHMPHLLKCGM